MLLLYSLERIIASFIFFSFVFNLSNPYLILVFLIKFVVNPINMQKICRYDFQKLPFQFIHANPIELCYEI